MRENASDHSGFTLAGPALRPRAGGLAGTVRPYSFHHAVNASIVGPRPRAR